MGTVRLCTGKIAETPFYLNNVCMNVYTVEELCYLFALNPFMISSALIAEPLFEWIEKECDLTELATKLRDLSKRGNSLGEYVDLILGYVNYCTPEERREIDKTLQSTAGMSDFERHKQQVDYLLMNGKTEAAIEEYEVLLGQIPEVDTEVRPFIYHNLGYAYASLFMFDIAARFFKRAYDINGLKDSGVQYLSALRMSFSEDKYIRFISENPELSDLSLALEKKVNRALGEFEGSSENIMLSALNVYKDEGKVSAYYEEIDNIIVGMKEDYISRVMN